MLLLIRLGALVVKARVWAAGIVEGLNVFKNLALHIVDAIEATVVQALRLQAVEERFHVRVVVTVSAPAHALFEAVQLQQGAQAVIGILDALVGVEHHAGGRTAALDGPLQRRAGELHTAPMADVPTDDLAIEQVHHYRQVDVARAAADVGDVRNPYLVAVADGVRLRATVLHQVVVGNVSLGPEASLRFGDQAMAAHQPGDALATDTQAVVRQQAMDAWCTVHLVAAVVVPPDVRQQALILERPGAVRAAEPCVVAASRHLQNAAQGAHPVAAAMPVYEPEDGLLVCEKIPMAFFKMAFSSRASAS